MAKRKHRRRQRDGVLGPALRPVAWSAALTAALAAVVPTPAQAEVLSTYADPLPDQVPDAGARPAPTGALQMPGGGTTTAVIPTAPVTSGLGPLAQQLVTAETEVATIGEQLKQVAIEREQIQAELATLRTAWEAAQEERRAAEKVAETAAEEAYKRAAELPPGAIGSDLHGLGAPARLQQQRPGESETAARDLTRARETEEAAYLAYTDAVARQGVTDSRYTGLQTTYKQREQALVALRQRNSTQLAAIEREREAREQRLGAVYLNGASAAGMQAHEKAKRAVQFALAQLGEPYLWGAEGPNRWDCSGLMWAAYGSVGQTLPRVSRDQYQGTRTREVSPTALVPGDLLFFSSSRTDASKIHHVGMYIGGGKMVHAPTTGDVVKISTVWWSRFFAATRVVGAVRAPAAGPTTPASPTTPPSTPAQPRPTPTPSATPKPPASPTPSPSPTTGSPTPTPSPTTSSPEPTPTTTQPSNPPA
jgi:cell wall-associated NlpC family hydrolase